MSEFKEFEALANTVGDAIAVCDADGKIIYWNRAAERIFGFAREEALGNSLDIIIPERMRERHWDGYRKTMETGQTRYGTDVLRVPATGKDGKPLSIAFTVALLHGPDGRVSAIASIMRDETERFNHDRALRKRVQELEALLRAKETPAAT
jgi:PAS domain S-box-containing protein